MRTRHALEDAPFPDVFANRLSQTPNVDSHRVNLGLAEVGRLEKLAVAGVYVTAILDFAFLVHGY
jgi:hypothetical protein